MSSFAEVAERHFTDHLASERLPVRQATVREVGADRLQMVMVDHAPTAGRWFDPIADTVVSIVFRSNASVLERDLGSGPMQLHYRPGALLITPPGSPSFWRFEGTPQVLHFSLPGDCTARLATMSSLLPARLANAGARDVFYDPGIVPLAKRLWDVFRADDAAGGQEGLLEAGLGVILGLALRNHLSQGTDALSGRPVAPLSIWRLRKVMQQIAGQRQPLGIAELAQSVGLSSDHFIRSFKAATGRSPHEMMIDLRMARARQLLSESDLSITEIALELGFSSSSHFATQFRQCCGATPSQWRAADRDRGD